LESRFALRVWAARPLAMLWLRNNPKPDRKTLMLARGLNFTSQSALHRGHYLELLHIKLDTSRVSPSPSY
jgi:hypothetical protein